MKYNASEHNYSHWYCLIAKRDVYKRQGIDAASFPADTRTLEQKASLLALLRELTRIFPRAMIVGHHNLNPTKACRCFDAEWEHRGL